MTRSSFFRRLLSTAGAVMILAAGMVAGTGTAIAAPGPSAIAGVESGRCLDVFGYKTDNGSAVGIYGCNSQINQQWTLTPQGELRVYNGTKCLDVPGGSTTPGTAPFIYDCNGGTNQQWTVGGDGTIVGVGSGLCLDVSGRGTADFSAVIIWTCNGQTNQQWRSSLNGTDTTAPSVPADPRASDLSCKAVTFSWNAATDDVGVAAYDVYHDGQFIKSVPGDTLSTGLDVPAGVQWGLYVNARDAAGNISQASATVPISVPQCQIDTQAPTAPGNLTASASGTSVALTWTASTDDVGVRSYDVRRGATTVGSVTAPATTFTDSGLTPATAYSYTVVARDAQANVSAPSNTASVTTGSSCGSAVCQVTQITTDTDIPWGLTTLPDGAVLYSRRDAHDIIRLDPATGAKTDLGTVPNVESTDGEGGLLGLAISSSFATDSWLYIMHTSPTDNRVVRMKVSATGLDLGSEQVLLTGILRNKFHNGGRLRFGPDGKLYISAGDGQSGDSAQDVKSLNGKILRINPDGTVPADNPFGNAVWSYGHRNPQGLAFDSQGRLWEQEFGNSTMDETNLIVRGGNYGWPSCEGTSGTCGTAGFIAPKQTYPVANGSCSGIAIVRDVLYVACLRGQRLYREVISGESLTQVTTYFSGTYGRLRTVEPDGAGGLWLTTSNSGDKDSIANNSDEKIFRVTLGG